METTKSIEVSTEAPVAFVVRAAEDGSWLDVETIGLGIGVDEGTIVTHKVSVNKDHPLFELFADFAAGVTVTCLVDALTAGADAILGEDLAKINLG